MKSKKIILTLTISVLSIQLLTACGKETAPIETNFSETVEAPAEPVVEEKEVIEDVQPTIEEESVSESATSEEEAYEQQLAEENGTPMPTETVTMYAVEKADIYKEADEAAKTVGAYAKGDSVDVAKVESEWATVVLSDGVNAYVDAALLANEMPSEKAETAQTQPVPETPVADVPQQPEVPETEPQTTPVPEVPQATPPSTNGAPAGWTDEEWAELQAMGATTGSVGGGSQQVVIDPDTLEKSDYNYANVVVY